MSTPRSLDLPDCVTARTISTSRGEFAALEAVPATPATYVDGPPVALLLPGWTGSKEDYLAVLEPIAAAGYRAVTIDQRGQYETPGPSDPGGYTLTAFGADAVDVADSLDAPVIHLVGHSFGGLVARSAVLTDPYRFTSITLLCSGPGAHAGTKAAQLRVMAAALPVTGPAAVYTVKRQLDRAGGGPAPSPEVEAFLKERFHANSVVGLTEVTRHLVEAIDEVDALAGTGLPSLVVSGADDDGWPLTEQAEMAERLGTDHVLIEGAGHSPAVDQPEALASTLAEFWRGVRS